jgi:hypothetical protein
MLTLHFFTREACTLCHSALAVVKRIQNRIPFNLQIQDIDENPGLRHRYDTVIPVVAFNSHELARSFFDEKSLEKAIRKLVSERVSEGYSRSLDNIHT